jgi:hypothetical protein
VLLNEGGYLMAFGACYGCRLPFAFDPALVPVIQIEGGWQPLCRHCVALANPIRQANGMLPIVPMPGAYLDV